MQFSTTKKIGSLTVVCATLLTTTLACSKQRAVDTPQTTVVEERQPTARELEAAKRLAPSNETTVETVQHRTPDHPANIPGVDEALDLAKDVAEKINVNGAIFARLGKVAWQMVRDNQSVVNVDQSRVSYLPDVKDWRRLGGFKAPQVHAFTVRVKNIFGDVLVRYDYAIAFDYGGSVDGRGKYLMNLTVINSSVSAWPTFRLDSDFVTYSPTNKGTSEQPVPAVMGEIRWTAKNVFTNIHVSNAFWVAGDGSFKTLNGADTQEVSTK